VETVRRILKMMELIPSSSPEIGFAAPNCSSGAGGHVKAMAGNPGVWEPTAKSRSRSCLPIGKDHMELRELLRSCRRGHNDQLLLRVKPRRQLVSRLP
jgi:hypothetical protein